MEEKGTLLPPFGRREERALEYRLTVKENFLRFMSGEMPEYIPKFEMEGWFKSSSVKFGSGYVKEDGTRVDEFGVEYTSVATALTSVVVL